MKKYLQTIRILLPVLFLSFSNCAGPRVSKSDMFEKKPPFTINEAYFQKWVAGIKEGGSGISVHLVFGQIDPNVEIEDLFFRNQVLKTQNSKVNKNEYIAQLSFSSENEITMDIDPMKESVNTPPQDFSFQLNENEAVVGYLFEGKRSYFKISDLSEKPQIAYPQSNPNFRN